MMISLGNQLIMDNSQQKDALTIRLNTCSILHYCQGSYGQGKSGNFEGVRESPGMLRESGKVRENREGPGKLREF